MALRRQTTVGGKRAVRGADSEKRGRKAEISAILFLRCKFYRILERRMRNAAGEVDVVALAPSRTLCFIEVKARPDESKAAEALGVEQRGRIGRAAALYLGRHPKLRHNGVRFDVLYVVPGRLPRHVKNAWQLDGV